MTVHSYVVAQTSFIKLQTPIIIMRVNSYYFLFPVFVMYKVAFVFTLNSQHFPIVRYFCNQLVRLTTYTSYVLCISLAKIFAELPV